MLRLKRVEIQGFKSFCDRTEMRFHGSGIAAIVGPNGCGKSNLSDAISWVLGEQSAKTLRGARMEDVIFAGTRDRKPLGAASVTLTLMDPAVHATPEIARMETTLAEVNLSAGEVPNGNGASGHGINGHGTNGHASLGPAARGATGGAAKGEITITRRLYRSGESEYLINGRIARLRDIQDLFMGTGLGPESYAIIEQGRIGQILSNKPQDRRAVIEEAAGVTKFKTRKRLAEAKLESAKQNLTRVFDILEEVGRQVNSLKRQASKAKRYEELRTEMVAHLRVALTGRYQALERTATKMALDLNAAAQEFQALSAAVGEKEHEQAQRQEQFYSTERELTEGRKKLADLRLEAERTRGRLENQARQIGGIDERLARGETETQDIEARAAQVRQEQETHALAVKELEEQTEAARARLAAKNQERDSRQAALRQRERDMESARQQALRLLGEASSLRNQLAQIDEYLAAIERDTARSAREEQTASGDLDRLNAVKDDLSTRIAARQLELQSIAGQRREVEESLSARRSMVEETRRDLEKLRGEFSRQKARKESLEGILSHRAYTTEAVKGLFTAIEQGRMEGLRPAGVLADFVEVTDATYEKAAEEFLHEELEYVVVSNWEEAEKGIERMRSDLDGRATFLLHPEAGADAPAGLAGPAEGEAGIAGRLSNVLRFSNGLAASPAGFLPRLENCFLAQDRDTARRLAVEYPNSYFLLADGVSYHGWAVSGGKNTGSGPLALKRELRELMGLVHVTGTQVEEMSSSVATLESDIAALSEELERLRGVQQSQEKDALALDHQNRKLAEEYANASSRLSVARLELERLGRERARSGEQRERNQQAVGGKEQARVVQEQSLADARGEWERLQAELAGINEEHAALRADLAGYEERRRSVRATEERLEAQMREFTRRRDQLAQEMERMGVDRARLLADNIELDARAVGLGEAMTSADAAVRSLEALAETMRASLGSLEETLRALRMDAQAAQERRSQTELELVKKQEALKYLDETSRKELGTPVAEMAAGEETTLDEDALEEMERKYQEVRSRIEALGPVNAQALEEFQEAQQRYDFLNAQRQDLLDSIRDTEKAIHEIDAESRKRFGEAFEAINANFRETFKTLFAGGSGEMRLTDEANIAESGIDIVAQPPGKKLQNVLLLSGGEKSLTAMSLLMAIFRYQPSPLCILDEIDAPLDEANIVRLTRLIKDMSTHTQFIVITHAKRTMEAAQVLYGVTMQEPGVSKLVGVKFDPTPEPAEMELAAV
ncbi:MAG: chromosome segregation protein SMC [Bryobacteraceae bacterium]